jgi:hypothetical protein
MELEYEVIEDAFDDTTHIRTMTEQAPVPGGGWLIRTTLYTPHHLTVKRRRNGCLSRLPEGPGHRERRARKILCQPKFAHASPTVKKSFMFIRFGVMASIRGATVSTMP